jgi:hypothetical protein
MKKNHYRFVYLGVIAVAACGYLMWPVCPRQAPYGTWPYCSSENDPGVPVKEPGDNITPTMSVGEVTPTVTSTEIPVEIVP